MSFLNFVALNSSMKKYLALYFIAAVMLMNSVSRAQLAWSGYSGSPYSTGTSPNNMQVTISSNQVTFGDGTPKYSTSTSPNCYIAAGGLALYAGFFNSYTSATNSHITVTMRFNVNYSGTCNRISFQIKDLNSDESTGTFCDVVEISATDGANNAIAAASITTTLASNVNRSVSGSTVKLVGHNSSTETIPGGTTPTSYGAGAACGTTTVTITPPANEELKTVTIKYRPAYGTSSSNAYYNTGTRPAAQYISIGSLTLTSNGSCTILPIELTSFNAVREDEKVLFNWETASEQDNDYFTIERTLDGESIEEIAQVPGAGNSSTARKYRAFDPLPVPGIAYYRLKQTDFNGQYKYFDWISVAAQESQTNFMVQRIAPNPSNGTFRIFSFAKTPVEAFVEVMDASGRVVHAQTEAIQKGSNITNYLASAVNPGMYTLRISIKSADYVSVHKIVIE